MKKLFVILIIFSIIFSFSCTINIANCVDGEKWLTGWTYRKSHTIKQTTGAGEGYQIAIVTDFDNGTDGTISIYGLTIAGLVYLNGTCQTDFDDIRFTENDGESLLFYWCAEKFDSYNATYWVKIKNDLGTQDRIIYIYWGNEGVSDISDGENTFIEFDDFNDGVLNATKWVNQTQDAGTVITETNGKLQIFCTTGYAHTGGCIIGTKSLSSYEGKTVMTKIMKNTGYTGSFGAYSAFCNSTTLFDTAYYCLPKHYIASRLIIISGSNWLYISSNAGWLNIAGSVNVDVYGEYFKVSTKIISSSLCNATFNKTESAYQSNSLQTSPSSASPVPPDFIALGVGEYNTLCYNYFDWVAVRKWIVTQQEPEHNEWGDLETGVPPTPTPTVGAYDAEEGDMLVMAFILIVVLFGGLFLIMITKQKTGDKKE